MRNPRRSSRKRIEGKSLIEILMVITIIGILASFLLSVIAVGIKRAKGVGEEVRKEDVVEGRAGSL